MTEASPRAVPLQTVALEAIERQPSSRQSGLVFPALRGGYLDLHNFRNREWKPAQVAAGNEPLRRIYDLLHTFATFALFALRAAWGAQTPSRRPKAEICCGIVFMRPTG
jgi:integrase